MDDRDTSATLFPPWWIVLRDVLMVVGGLFGLYYETVVHAGEPRTILVSAYLWLLTSPAFMHRDKRKARDELDD